MTQVSTKERIIESAEFLFARNGYRGTSLRAITERAGVNLAAVNYHFGSKLELLESLLSLRLSTLNKIRTEKIRSILRESREMEKNPDVREILEALIVPAIHFKKSEKGIENFIALIGRSFSDPDNTVRMIFMRFMTPMFNLVLKALKEAMPGLPEETIVWRLHFVIGSMAHTMQMCGNHSQGMVRCPEITNSELVLTHLIPFVTAGMEAER